MKNFFRTICLLILFSYSYGGPSIGVTPLLYKDDLALKALSDKVALDKAKFQMSDKVLKEVIKKLPQYEIFLTKSFSESDDFTVFNADSIFYSYRNKGPWLLDSIYKTVAVDPPTLNKESGIKNKAEDALPKIRKYILLGWIENIVATQNRELIPGTKKISFLYSLDITVEYRLVNIEKQKVVAVFTAKGHGGMAKLLASVRDDVSYNISEMVDDMLYSLANNTHHGVILKQQQFIKSKLQLKNAAKLKEPGSN